MSKSGIIKSYVFENLDTGHCLCMDCGNLDIAHLRNGDWDDKKFHRYGYGEGVNRSVRVICKNCGNDAKKITISFEPLV